MMPPSASNRYSVLSEEDPDLKDLRIEMEELQQPRAETEQSQAREVNAVSASDPIARLSAFGLQLSRAAGAAEEVQVPSKAMEVGEAPATSSTKGSHLPRDEVRDLFFRWSAIVDMSLICRQGNAYPTKAR